MSEISTITKAEYCTLPSQGKIYADNINSRVKMRSMTTAEEMRRLSPCDHPYENMCSIIDDCILDGPAISSYDMCMADYTFLLYRLRTVTYGPIYKIASKCPLCKATNEGEINLDMLEVHYDEEALKKYKTVELPNSKKKIELRFQTPRMMDAINDRVKEFKRKTDRNIDSTLLFSITSLIETVDGRVMDDVTMTQWVRNLDMVDSNTIWRYSEKLEDSIKVDRLIDSECDLCGYQYKTKMTIGKDFFRPVLDI